VRAVVARNRIELTGDAVGFAGGHSDDVQLVGNVLSGEGRAAVALAEAPEDGSPAAPALGWTVGGNDLSAFTASQADVVLGPGSDSVTVVCGGPATVQDDGSGNRVVCEE
jgi:hypothetical protein